MENFFDPQQELFSRLKVDLERAGFAVYDDFLPPENTPYPFVFFGDVQQIETPNKSAVWGDVHFTIHLWHNDPLKRGTASRMLAKIKYICRNLSHTGHFAWCVRSATQDILPDNTTDTPLLHGVLEMHFTYSF